jgi:Icc-related predicted phosphoesterase
MAGPRYLFATDLHGSEVAFRKFVNAGKALKVDVLILGGDLTGKALVPLIRENGGYAADFNGQATYVEEGSAAEELEQTIRLAGQYPIRIDAEEYEQLLEQPNAVAERFHQAMRETLTAWFDLAQERVGDRGVRLLVIAGNDDPFEIDSALSDHPYAEFVDGQIAVLEDGTELVGFGGSNPTPWDSPREYSEQDIEARLGALVAQLEDPARSIWSVHVPPRATGLDTAAEIDGEFRIVRDGGQPRPIPVGSQSVRELIERVEPGLGLHGHVHESRAVANLGRSVVVNPGSEYTEGVLRGVLVRPHKEKGYQVQVFSG